MFNTYHEMPKKAVAYYRHSAEDKQENSVAIQKQHVESFASLNNIEIIHYEADEGKSGLLSNRPAFERLFTDWIENPNASQFDYVLVYDVSRWGRFQNQDEAGYFAHICTRNNKMVVYVTIGFPSETNQLISSLGISLHRYMAAEYSRQLSEKVFYGSVKVSQQGYSAGGTATYGMARELLDVNKKHIRILEKGEHKQIANERVSFIPKHDETTDTVCEIFDLFVRQKYQIQGIAIHLNRKGLRSANGGLWNKSKILKILSNEIYTGTRIYNKIWGRLKQKSYRNPRSEWIIIPNAFEAIINEQLFKKTQERLYWIFPNNWRKGANAIRQAKKIIKNEIFRWLLNNELSDCEAEQIMSELPIIFSVKVKNGDQWNLCFSISEKFRRYDKVLALSVISDGKYVIDELFLFQVNDFTRTNFLVLSYDSTLYRNTKIKDDNLEQAVRLLISQLKDSRLSIANILDLKVKF